MDNHATTAWNKNVHVSHDAASQQVDSVKVQSVDCLTILLLPLFCLTSLLKGVAAVQYINRYFAVVLILLFMVSLLAYGARKWMYVTIFLFAAVTAVAFGLTEWTSKVIAAAPRAMFCIMLLYYTTSRFEEMLQICVRYKNYIQGVLILWTALVAVSIPMSSSWSTQWGGSDYFTSYVSTAFELMPTALLAMSLNLVCLRIDGNSTKALLLSLIPLYAGLQGGSRTYFILVLLMFVLILLNCHLSSFELGILTACAVVVVVISLPGSGIGEKMANVTSDQQQKYSGYGFIGTLTSGRSVFWIYDIKAFLQLNLLQQFVGNGYDFVYQINLEEIGSSIYAHNDFINLLLESGYIGLFVYLSAIVALFGRLWSKSNNSKVALFTLFFLWFANAFINSFYTYTCSVIAFTFAAVSFGISPDYVRLFKKSDEVEQEAALRPSARKQWLSELSV